MIGRLVVGFMFLALAACSEDVAEGGGPASSVRDASPTDYVKISRTACFGSCPVFDLTLYGDGRVLYHGGRFTKEPGQQMDQFSEGRFIEAVDMLKARGFEAMPSSFNRDTCELWATDHPSVVIEVRATGLNKTLDWYTGCRGIPERSALERMVSELEDLLEVERFIGTEAERRATVRR